MALKKPRVLQVAALPSLTELADLWREGLGRNHDPGCGCGGLFAPALSARVIEEDFLAYLHARYVKEGVEELVDFIGARTRGDTQGVGMNTFESWIASIECVAISRGARERLVKDIYTFVESMAGGGKRGPGVCY